MNKTRLLTGLIVWPIVFALIETIVFDAYWVGGAFIGLTLGVLIHVMAEAIMGGSHDDGQV